jgi:prepilin-type N-terminal cleavage/methylation domain-containing protein
MKNNENGFTLLELLTVLTIISILSAIAIPKYKEYRQRAFDTVAQLDLKNLAIAEEAYYFDYQTYLACENDSCLNLAGLNRFSKDVNVRVETSAEDQFIAYSKHTQGTGREFIWDSQEGGMR